MSNVIQAPYIPPSTTITAPRAIITRSGESILADELAKLDIEFADRLREAREFGEGGSNDDYLQIKEEEAVVRSRIGRLEALLDSAEVVEDTQPEGLIDIG